MGAADATLTEALAHLEITWAEMLKSVLNDRHLLWIGSGVSRERFPDLPSLLERLFAELYRRQSASDPDCPYYRAAVEIVRNYSFVEGVDLRQPPASWPSEQRQALFNQLSSRYAQVLDQTITTPAGAKNIPFDILALEKTYSDPSVEPDAEHRLLALLIAEGAITQVITTNWDCLIEKAFLETRTPIQLWLVRCAQDLEGAGGVLLFKIHGCAERVNAGAAGYKQYLIATHNQITRWSVEPAFHPFAEKLRTLLRERPSLFIGISGQDFNLQSQCAQAACGAPAIPFPPPRITFSGTIRAPHKEILHAVHGQDYAPNAEEIERHASLPLYGKPLFGALYVALVLRKISVILDVGEYSFPSDAHRAFARDAVDRFRNALTGRYDLLPTTTRWQSLTDELPPSIARFLHMYRNQTLPADRRAYVRIHDRNPEAMLIDPNLLGTNLHWLVLALAAVYSAAGWGGQLRIPSEPDGSDGQLRMAHSTGEVDIFFTERYIAGLARLEQNNSVVVGSGRKVLVIYPNGQEPVRRHRNPGRVLPRSAAAADPRELWFEDCALEFMSESDLVSYLRQEIAATHPI